MIAELFPWRLPALLRIVSKSLPTNERFTTAQQTLVSTINVEIASYRRTSGGGLDRPLVPLNWAPTTHGSDIGLYR
jgi:hypothetical protein